MSKLLYAFSLMMLVGTHAALAATTKPSAPPSPSRPGDPFELKPGMREYADGLVQLRRFELSGAIESFTKALEKASDRGDILLARGLALVLSEKVALGEKDIAQAYNLNPRPAEAARLYAFMLRADRRGTEATRIYRVLATRETPFDRLLSYAGASYSNSNQPGHDTAEALMMFRTVAREYAEIFSRTLEAGRALYAAGMERSRNKEAAPAADALELSAMQFEDDATVLTIYGVMLSEVRDRESARSVLSRALSEDPAMVLAYLQRAVVAARMGSIKHAKQDVEIARLIEPKASWIPAVEKIIAECEAQMPKESGLGLFNSLLASARESKTLEQLAPGAAQLVLAANANRAFGQETYQERKHDLHWAMLVNSKDAAAISRVGQFMLDELDVRGDYVDPGQNFVYYREQDKDRHQRELETARTLFKKAAGINTFDFGATKGLGEIAYQENRWGDAQNYMTAAMRLRESDPEVLDFMSKLMHIAAGQAMSRAMSAATPEHWTEYGSGYEIHWTRYGDPAAANTFSNQADGLLGQADEYIKRALQVLQKTPESYDFVGTLALRKNNFEIMRKSYEEAVKLVPDKIEYRYALANAYSKLNQLQPYLEQTTIGRGLEHTSAAGHLQQAWRRINDGKWIEAAILLQMALKVDPADARIPAFMGAMLEGQKDYDGAMAAFKTAMAIEEAKAFHRGASYLNATGRWDVEDVALVASLRMRIARLIEEKDPKAAMALYQQNQSLEAKLTTIDMMRPLPSAMLPEPNRPPSLQMKAPNMGGMLRMCRALAAVAMSRLNQSQQAMNEFERLNNYDDTAVRAGERKDAPLVGIWSPRNYYRTAAELSRTMGNNPRIIQRWESSAESYDRSEADQLQKAIKNGYTPPVRGMTIGGGNGRKG